LIREALRTSVSARKLSRSWEGAYHLAWSGFRL